MLGPAGSPGIDLPKAEGRQGVNVYSPTKDLIVGHPKTLEGDSELLNLLAINTLTLGLLEKKSGGTKVSDVLGPFHVYGLK